MKDKITHYPVEQIHPRRRKEMEKTRNAILRELKKIRATPFWGKEIDDCVFKMFVRRAEKIGIRSYFVRKIYEYVLFMAQQEEINLCNDISEHTFMVKIPFLVEAVISLQYLDNQILDQKGGVTTQKKINQNLLASKLFGLFLRRDYINDSFPAEYKDRVACQLERMFEMVDVGQCLEKRYGAYTNFVTGLPESEVVNVGRLEDKIPYDILDAIWIEIKKDKIPKKQEQFIRQYLKRAYLCNASLFVLAAEIVMDLLGYEGNERQNILTFANYYGMVIQFVNDNNDYLSFETVEKKPENSFADLKNETMSLPLLYYFRRRNHKNSLKLLQEKFAKSEKEALQQMLPTLENYSIPLTKQIALLAVKFLNEAYKDHELLVDMVNIAHENKYYRSYEFENTT